MSDVAALIAAKLTELWRTSRPAILERVAVLRAAHTALTANPRDTAARRAAREAAHKLSGVLGTFGLPQGSEIAAALEHLLQSGSPLTPADLAFLAGQTSALDAVIASRDRD